MIFDGWLNSPSPMEVKSMTQVMMPFDGANFVLGRWLVLVLVAVEADNVVEVGAAAILFKEFLVLLRASAHENGGPGDYTARSRPDMGVKDGAE